MSERKQNHSTVIKPAAVPPVKASAVLTGLDLPVRVLVALARHLHQICTAKVSQVLAADGLTPLEFGAVILLGEFPGIDQNTVAAKMAIDRTSISAMVFKLEKQKLVKRAVHADDRRARTLCLTPVGEALRVRLRPQSRAAQQSVLSSLSPTERENFLNMLVRVVAANEAYARPGIGRRKPIRGTQRET